MLTNQKPSFGSFLVGTYLSSVPIFSYSSVMALTFIPQIIGAFLSLYAVYELLKIRVFNKNISIIFYFLFSIWSVVSFPFSEYKSQNSELLTLAKTVIITGCAAFLIRNQTEFIFSLAIFFISIFLAFWLNLEDILGFRNFNSITNEERFAGTLGSANTAALYGLAITWSGLMLLFTTKRNLIRTLLILMGLILAGIIVLYSGSRKGLIGLAFISIATVWIPIKKFGSTYFRKTLLAILLLGITCAIVIVIFRSPFSSRMQTMFQGDASTFNRVYLFKEAINVWLSSLKNTITGVGIGNFSFHNSLHTYSHSTVSETLVCTGIIGFGLYYIGFLSIFSSFINSLRFSKSEEKTNILLVIIFLFLILFFSLTAVMYNDRLFWPLLGIISSYGITLKKNNLSS